MALFSNRQGNTFFITQLHTNQLNLTKLPSLKLMGHILQSYQLLHLFLHPNIVYAESSALL